MLFFVRLLVVILYVVTPRTSFIAIELFMAAIGAVSLGWLSPNLPSGEKDCLDPMAVITAGQGERPPRGGFFARCRRRSGRGGWAEPNTPPPGGGTAAAPRPPPPVPPSRQE
ncbi:hypothetical protein UK12_33940, partial [Saccharothrix sp. ST-888]